MLKTLASMCNRGFFHYKAQEANFNRHSLLIYLEKLLTILERKNIGNAAIIMNNASFHRCWEIKDYTNRRRHELIFLPPYTPFFNPIENVFSQWKNLVKGAFPISYLQQKINVNYIKKNLTQEQSVNYFKHAHNNVHKYLSGIPVN